MKLGDSHCIVIKVGSALLINEQQRSINTPWLLSLIDDVAELIRGGAQVVLVSSGAMAFGRLSLQLPNKLSLDKQQATAAVGQIQLVHQYQTLLQQQGLDAAQILLTLDDSEDRKRYINIRNTLKSLLSMGVVPIINENDTVATSEIRYGDNDRLAARVAQMVDADTLVLLSDIDGLYTADPRKVTDATLIPLVDKLTQDIFSVAGESGTRHGSGGMITKLAAAKIVMNCGCRMLITAGKHHHPIKHYIQHERGTWFVPHLNRKKAKKSWLREHLNPAGQVVIDEGAFKALSEGASLLPVGVVSVSGEFSKGALLQVLSKDNSEIARGLSNYDQKDLNKIVGVSSQHIEDRLGYDGCHEVIHRDNLVLINN